MRIPRLKKRSLAAAAVAGVALVALTAAAMAQPVGHPGKGDGKHGKKHHHGKGNDHHGNGFGREKVVICHKGHTITVGKPAARAHLRHGDTLGACQHQPTPTPTPPPPHHTATLTVIKHVVNDNGGTKTAADFALTIAGVTASGGNTVAGSEAGVTKTLTSFGSYSVTEAAVAGYAQTQSEGCSGTIAAGEQKTCVITNDDVPATLTVIKHVVNNNGGTKTAADFTLTINNLSVDGTSSFAGSEAGVTRTLKSIGPYSVTEIVLPGYHLASASSDCSGTIALGDHKTCVLTNDDTP